MVTAPLCAFARYPAWLLWQGLNLAAWATALALAWRTRPEPVTFAGVALLVAQGSTSAQVHMGQVAWLLALPLTLSWLKFRGGAFHHAGLWLGLVLAIKPFLALAAVTTLLDRRWRITWLTAAVTALCIGGLGYWLLGAEVYARWAAWSGPAVALGRQPMNVGLTSVAWLLGLPPLTGVVLGVALGLAAVPRWRRITNDRQWLVMLTLLVLSAPLGWLHYATWVLPVLWCVWPTLASPLRLWALSLLCLPTLVVVLDMPGSQLVYTTGLLLLAWAGLRSTTDEARG